MSYRQQAAKPTAALWLLVAVVDVALVLASAGIAAVVALVSVVTVAVAGIGTWRHLRRGPVPAALSARRREP